MTKKRRMNDFLTPSALGFLSGLIIIVAGIYFQVNSLTSSGMTMGRYGKPYRTGTIDGKGMIFCGVVIVGFALLMREGKDSENEL